MPRLPTNPAPEVLTIVGASARAAAQSARRAGFSPSAADLFADVDLRRICSVERVKDYPHGLARLCAGSQPGGWMYTGALENYPELVGRLAEIRPLFGNGAEVLRTVRDLDQVASVVTDERVGVPARAQSAAGIPRDGSWLVKPHRSAGGANIRLWTKRRAPEISFDRCYLQERVSGLSCSAVYVGAAGTAVMLGATEQWVGTDWTGAPAFAYAGSMGPLALEPWQRDALTRIGERLASEFRLVGLFGVDFILSREQVWVLEVNPRYTASVEVLERVLGTPAIALHVAACREGALPGLAAFQESGECAAKIVLYARRDGTFPTALFESIEPHLSAAWPRYADVPAPGAEIRAGRPVMTLLSGGQNAHDAMSTLRAETLQVSAALESVASE